MIKKVLLLTCLLGINQPNAGLLTETEIEQVSHCQLSTSAPKLSKFDSITTNHQQFNDAMKNNPPQTGYLLLHKPMFEWRYYLAASIYNHIFTDEMIKLHTKSTVMRRLLNNTENPYTILTLLEHISVDHAYFTYQLTYILNVQCRRSSQEQITQIKEFISRYDCPEANSNHLESNITLYGTKHDIDLDWCKRSNTHLSNLKLLKETLDISETLKPLEQPYIVFLNNPHEIIYEHKQLWNTHINVLREQLNKLGFAHSIIDTSLAYDKHESQFNYEDNTAHEEQYIFPSDLISNEASAIEKIQQCASEEVFDAQISPELYAAVAEKIVSHLITDVTNQGANYLQVINYIYIAKHIIDIKFNIPNHRDDIKALYNNTIKRRSYIMQFLINSHQFDEHHTHQVGNILSYHIKHANMTKLFIDFSDTDLNQDISNLSVDEIMEKCKAAEVMELFDPRNYVDMMLQGSFNMHLGLFLIQPNFI